jgi:hypothetical protein
MAAEIQASDGRATDGTVAIFKVPQLRPPCVESAGAFLFRYREHF